MLGEQVHELVAEARWTAPGRGALAHLLREAGDAATGGGGTPSCRDAAFVSGYTSGQGAAAAAALQRAGRKVCLKRARRGGQPIAERVEQQQAEDALRYS